LDRAAEAKCLELFLTNDQDSKNDGADMTSLYMTLEPAMANTRHRAFAPSSKKVTAKKIVKYAILYPNLQPHKCGCSIKNGLRRDIRQPGDVGKLWQKRWIKIESVHVKDILL